MPEMVGYLLLFTGVGIAFVLVNLSVGKLIRPARMDAEKATIYECGEPTIGSAWVQFDLRFYVVALLFVIFDVEMAFFFPWAVVFGRANQLADPRLPASERAAITKDLVFPPPNATSDQSVHLQYFVGLMNVNPAEATPEQIAELLPAGNRTGNLEQDRERLRRAVSDAVNVNQYAAAELAWVAFFDILFFFGVLLVGFAYLWKRGDLNWVRSMAAQLADRPAAPLEPARPREQLVMVTKD